MAKADPHRLGGADAHTLLASAVSGRLGRGGARPDGRWDCGNPHALLQLPSGLGPAELAGGFLGCPPRGRWPAARLNGMAALIVTNAVGALSAINGWPAPTPSKSR